MLISLEEFQHDQYENSKTNHLHYLPKYSNILYIFFSNLNFYNSKLVAKWSAYQINKTNTIECLSPQLYFIISFLCIITNDTEALCICKFIDFTFILSCFINNMALGFFPICSLLILPEFL